MGEQAEYSIDLIMNIKDECLTPRESCVQGDSWGNWSQSEIWICELPIHLEQKKTSIL